MVTKYQRPSGTYAGDATLANRKKYQKDSNQEPKVSISSVKIDSDFNYLVDAINETNTKIVQASAGAILDGAISTVKLSDGAVTTEKFATGCVDTNAMADACVSTKKLAEASVDTSKLTDVSITASKLADGSVTSDKILDGNVLSKHIAASAVMNSGIADNAITADKIEAGAVTASKLEASGVAAGTYTSPTVTLDDKGRVTSATSGSAVNEQQLCKAWVNFNGTGTVTIRDSYNVSSITDHATGTYRINFETAMANINYSICATPGGELGRTIYGQAFNTSYAAVGTTYNRVLEDQIYVFAQIFGD